MSRRTPDSRAWWKNLARGRQYVINVLNKRLTEVLTDHDALEAELKDRIKTCTCGEATK